MTTPHRTSCRAFRPRAMLSFHLNGFWHWPSPNAHPSCFFDVPLAASCAWVYVRLMIDDKVLCMQNNTELWNGKYEFVAYTLMTANMLVYNAKPFQTNYSSSRLLNNGQPITHFSVSMPCEILHVCLSTGSTLCNFYLFIFSLLLRCFFAAIF